MEEEGRGKERRGEKETEGKEGRKFVLCRRKNKEKSAPMAVSKVSE